MQPARDTGEGLNGAARHSYAHAQYIHSLSIGISSNCVSLALAETTHGVY